MTSQDARLEIVEMGALLEPGYALRAVCPFCNATHEKSFSVKRTHDGALTYKCFRNKCNASGYIGERPTSITHKQTEEKKKGKRYEKETTELPDEWVAWMYDVYGITKYELRANGFKHAPDGDWLYMPIFDYWGQQRGEVLKAFYPRKGRPKNLVYWHDGDAGVHFTHTNRYTGGTIVLVEDVLSAVKLGRYVDTVALLGTHLTDKGAKEISEMADMVYICLDRDTWDRPTHVGLSWQPQSIRLIQQHGYLFKRMVPLMLETYNDPKDMSDFDIREEILSNVTGGYAA